MKKLAFVLILLLFLVSCASTLQENKPPSMPECVFPPDGSFGLGPEVVLEWRASDPDGDPLSFTLWFGSASPENMTAVASLTDSRYDVSDLLAPGSTYFWQVAVSDGSTSVVGDIWNFQTRANAEPLPPSTPTPVDGAEEVASSVTLQWNCQDPDGDNLTFEIYFGEDFESVYDLKPEALIATTSEASYCVRDLSPYTYYYWKVVALDVWRERVEGPLWMFRTADFGGNHPPEIPHSPYPPDGATGIATEIILSWECVDPDDDKVLFDVCLGESESSLATVATYLESPEHHVVLNGSTTYYWRVIAFDENGGTSQSPVWRFTTVGTGTVASGKTYYVSPYGDDENPGTHELPWRTPAVAVKRLSPGDTLVFLEGTYLLDSDEDVIAPVSGLAGATIILKADDGANVVLAGCENIRAAFDLSGCRYLVIKGLEITHAPEGSCSSVFFRDAISALDAPVEHVILENLYVHHVDEFGLNVADALDLRVLDSTFTHCGFGCMGGPEGSERGWRNVLIDGCYLGYSGWYYQGGNGEGNPYDRPDGFGIEVSEGPVEISNCLVEHNKGDGLDSKAANTYIHHCVVKNNSCDGIKVWGTGSRIENCLVYGKGDGDPTPSPWGSIVIDQVETPGATFEVVNVTVHDPVNETYPVYIGYTGEANFSVLLRNVIILGNLDPVFVGNMVDLSMDHSLVFIPNAEIQIEYAGTSYTSEMIESGTLGEGNLSRDPLFANPVWGVEEGDYHLREESPAIDAGTAEGAPSDDLEHHIRPQGGGFDIGAYER
ncbi:MAG TPA: hypothetical protein DHV12_09095 [Thermotogae bacterium]|nr:hypothetical protein [Thermotogota bacterium]